VTASKAILGGVAFTKSSILLGMHYKLCMEEADAMSDLFTPLEAISAKLNATSDAISETIKRVEAKLSALRLGVEVWLKEPISINSLRDSRGELQEKVSTYLGYTKINGKWQLALGNDLGSIEGHPEDDQEVPLLQAPREDRVKAVLRVPELIKAIEAKAKEELQHLEFTLDTIEF
jgi:hypothetical protein